ncbi:MAG: hypothetical protein DRI90_23230, partial [Deltaproteobacteria bacterium]
QANEEAPDVEGQSDLFDSAAAGVCEAVDCSSRGPWIHSPAQYIDGSGCASVGWEWGVSSCSD